MTPGTPTMSRRLRPHPSSVGAGRRFIRQVLQEHRRDDLCEAAELVISEVVTNALLHGTAPRTLTVEVRADSVRIEVADGSPVLPRVHGFASTASTGRGLRLLNSLASRWGADPDPDDGKVVWFEVGRVDDAAWEAQAAGWLMEVGAGEG